MVRPSGLCGGAAAGGRYDDVAGFAALLGDSRRGQQRLKDRGDGTGIGRSLASPGKGIARRSDIVDRRTKFGRCPLCRQRAFRHGAPWNCLANQMTAN